MSSIKTALDLSREHWRYLITCKSSFIYREFNWVSMSKIPSPLLQIERSYFILFQRKSYILSMSFLIYFEIVYVKPMYHSLDKKIWFAIIFLPLKECLTLFQIWIFLLYLHLFCLNWSYQDWTYKIKSEYLMER